MKEQRLDLRIDAQKGWRRFLLRCAYKLWQLIMAIFVACVLIAVLSPLAGLWTAGKTGDPMVFVMGLKMCAVSGVVGVIGILTFGYLEGEVWPTWWSC